MSRKKGKINGDDVTRKLMSLLIPYPRKDPKYMSNYMKIRRRYDKLDVLERGELTLIAEKYWTKIEETLLYKKIVDF